MIVIELWLSSFIYFENVAIYCGSVYYAHALIKRNDCVQSLMQDTFCDILFSSFRLFT